MLLRPRPHPPLLPLLLRPPQPQPQPQYQQQQFQQQYQQPQYQQQYDQPLGSAPSNHLVWAILCTIFCCLPLGIVSIVYASKVNSQWAIGDYAGAESSAGKAKTWALVGTIIGAFVYLLYGIAGVMAGTL